MTSADNRPLRVFLCHSSADKPAVRELYQKLCAEPWISPWLDEEELFPGMDWNMEIEKAIEATDVILVCLSSNSITKEGYVQREIRIALDYADYKPEGTLFIIPVRLEECKPPKRLARWQYADCFEKQIDRAFQRLLVSLMKRAETLELSLDAQNESNQKLSTNSNSSEDGNEKANVIRVVFNGNIVDSLINIGNGNTAILSKDGNGHADYQQAISNIYLYLDAVKTEFDRENAVFAKKSLENVKDIISKLGDEKLSVEYEILESRCLLKFEKVDAAKDRYENLHKRYPQDIRPLLYLAEICLGENDLEGNSKHLEKAEAIDEEFWLLKLQQILRKQHLGEGISIELIDEEAFPEDPKIKASFYRLYGLLLENHNDQTNADSFLAKAIHLNPNRFSTYLDELSLIERRMLASEDSEQKLQLANLLLNGIEKTLNQFALCGDIGARNKLYLSTKKLNALLVQENRYEIENLAKDIFSLAIACYFDKWIESIIAGVFKLITLPNNEFNRLLNYLKMSKKAISDDLSEVLIYQFVLRNTLYNDGKVFFRETGNQKYLRFINDLESENFEQILTFLENRVSFSLVLANTAPLILRKKIIANLPDDKTIQKDKLELLLKFDENDFDEAFQILKQLDLSSFDYFECMPILQVARQKKAWDFELVILEKLIAKERNEKELFNLNLQLSFVYLNLKKFPEAIELGMWLLKNDSVNRYLDSINQEGLLTNTLIACNQRGKIDSNVFATATDLIENYPLKNPSYEFKVGIEAEIYLNNNDARKALESVIDGVKKKNTLSSKEYADLHLRFVEIGNRITLNLESLPEVQKNTFVKLVDKDQWYFVGDENELDALSITEKSNKYNSFLGKKLGSKIPFENKYGTEKREDEIEIILRTDQYIMWQVYRNFQKLAGDGDLEWAQMIKIPQEGEGVDFSNLLKYFEEINSRTEPVFELYCNNNYPLAMLAVNEGGLIGAIGRIQSENRGYIHFSPNTTSELENQINIAKKILDENRAFYLDGTSALVLSETGLLQKIYLHLPNLKIPQSVIVFLGEVANRFQYTPGQTGHMGYARGKVTFSSVEEERRNILQGNFVEAVKLLETNPENIDVISLANKIDCLSETGVPEELCDACILAQKENIPVLTEDYFYLKLNELETKKKAPECFSTWALVRALYEKGHLTFDEYLDYFGYLSSYRFRFLPLSQEDIEKAVFGDRGTKYIKPENIRRFNFPLVLSEEYGVPFDVAFRVIGIFLLKLIRDDSVASGVVEKIFAEILNVFPTDKSKKDLGQMLLDACTKAVEGKMLIPFYRLEDKLRYQKINNLLRVAETYNEEAKLLTPN